MEEEVSMEEECVVEEEVSMEEEWVVEEAEVMEISSYFFLSYNTTIIIIILVQ
jgi:hypothetical protein